MIDFTARQGDVLIVPTPWPEGLTPAAEPGERMFGDRVAEERAA